MNRKELAQKKIDEWLAGVSEERFAAALAALVDELVSDGVLMLRDEGERKLIVEGGQRYYSEYARRVVELSDARCVYFAPDPRSRLRGVSNARAWAEYAVHAVTSGGAPIPGREYHTRWYNHRKVENLDLIEVTLRKEGCVPVLKSNPNADAIKFFGETHEGGVFDVVVRLDEYGNADANMTEVTFEVAKPKKVRCPRLMPLSEAVDTVVCHQAAGTNPSTSGHMIPQSDPAVNEAAVAKATNVTCKLRCAIATSDARMHHLALQTLRRNHAIPHGISRFGTRRPPSRPPKARFGAKLRHADPGSCA